MGGGPISRKIALRNTWMAPMRIEIQCQMYRALLGFSIFRKFSDWCRLWDFFASQFIIPLTAVLRQFAGHIITQSHRLSHGHCRHVWSIYSVIHVLVPPDWSQYTKWLLELVEVANYLCMLSPTNSTIGDVWHSLQCVCSAFIQMASSVLFSGDQTTHWHLT